MKNRLLLLSAAVFFLTALFISGLAGSASAGNLKVLLLPFEMHGAGDISKIRRGVMESIATVVDDSGGDLVGLRKVKAMMLDEGTKSFDEASAIKITKEIGADFVILGSLTSLGGVFNVDWRILDIHGGSFLKLYFTTATSERELLGKVKSEALTIYDFMGKRVSERPVARKGSIDKITIIGNTRIDAVAIEAKLASKAGSEYSPDSVKEDIRSIFGMGYFDDVTVEFSDTSSGRELRYIVKERPFLKNINISGNKELELEKIMEVITLKTNTVLDRVLLMENAEFVRLLYKENGFNLTTVEPEVTSAGLDATVTFNVDEGKEVRVKRITIIGNEKISDRKIRKLMQTKQKGFFSVVTGSGKFNELEFQNDLAIIMSYYFDHGYVQSDITRHTVQLSEDKKWFYVTLSITEGQQFKIGKLDVSGDILNTKSEILEKFELKEGEIFNRTKVTEGLDTVRFLYGDKGYANVDVFPQNRLNEEDGTIDITVNIEKHNPVTIENIDISGNVRTRDKVIRREVELTEGGLYSSSELKRSRNNLRRLGYFEDVIIRESPGSTRDKIDLNIDVAERATGAISIGVGYSSVDSIIGTASISQSNLMGTGLKLELSGTKSSGSDIYMLSLTEPWLFDKPISAGFSIYNNEREYPDFNIRKEGVETSLGFPLYKRYTRGYLTYKYETVDITGISDTATLTIKEQEGTTTVSSARFYVKHDTRDDFYFPREGWTLSASTEYAGGVIGGNVNYMKYEGTVIKFIPTPKKTTLSFRAMAGYVHSFSGQDVPIFQRYFLGGISSLRGFETRKVGPLDQDTQEYYGGTTSLVTNTELLFPLFGQRGMRGVIFYDAGNAYDGAIDFNDIRHSVGFGLRWLSPFGPIRLEWGFNLSQRNEEKSSEWEFGMGTSF